MKIRVLHMFIGNTKGGRTQYMLNNWNFIDRERFQFDFATLNKELDFAKELENQGCRIYYVSCYAEENEKQFIKEVEEIFRNHYDVVHVHFAFWRSFIIEECARKMHVKKLILHSHNTGIGMISTKEEEERLKKIHFELREQITDKIADEFFACSKEAAEWMYGDKIPEEKIRILKNGIDVQKFRYNEEIRIQVRKQLKLENKFVIGNIAKFVYQKNHEFLIDVFKKIVGLIPDAVLVLIGVGELQELIKEKVKTYGIEENVIFLGKRNDVEVLMQAMDVYAFPSRFEGLPFSLIEAQASGLPCVVSDAVPKEAFVTDLINVELLETEKWIRTINNIYHNQKERICPKEKLMKAGYDIRYQVKDLEHIYVE